MALTPDELQSIVSAVISSLQTNAKSIEQLTSVSALSDTDVFEIGGGKKVSYAVLMEAIAKQAEDKYEEIYKAIKNTVSDVALESIDTMTSSRYATTQTPGIYRVLVDGKVAGILLQYSDSGAHEITQEMHTTMTLQNGIFTGSHQDCEPKVFSRSYDISDKQWSTWAENPRMCHVNAKVDKADFVVMSDSEYDALASTDDDKYYFIYEE